MFSNLSGNSISLATVTPSLVTRGAPNDLSSTTVRPLGPSVTFTASARMSMTRSMRVRGSCATGTSFAGISSFLLPLQSASGGLFLGAGPTALDDAHYTGFLHDHQFFAVELDLGARPLAEQHAVAGLHVDRGQLARFV